APEACGLQAARGLGRRREPRGARRRRGGDRPGGAARAEEGDMSAYEVRRIDELDEGPVARAGIVWRPIRRPLGITAFGINAYMGKEGEHVVEEHDESQLGHREVSRVTG